MFISVNWIGIFRFFYHSNFRPTALAAKLWRKSVSPCSTITHRDGLWCLITCKNHHSSTASKRWSRTRHLIIKIKYSSRCVGVQNKHQPTSWSSNDDTQTTLETCVNNLCATDFNEDDLLDVEDLEVVVNRLVNVNEDLSDMELENIIKNVGISKHFFGCSSSGLWTCLSLLLCARFKVILLRRMLLQRTVLRWWASAEHS